MQVAAAQLAAHLAKGLRSLYTVHGDEVLLVQEACDAIRQAARARGYTERTVHTVASANADWSPVLASGGSLSLFAERQIVEVRLPGGKPGKEGAKALQQLAEAARDNADVLTLVVLPRLDATALKAAWFAALDANGVTVKVDSVERQALPAWIAERLRSQGQHVASGEAGQRTLQFFADRVEGNLLAAHQEIQKLALLYPPGELSFEQVEEAVLNVARYTPFRLAEAVLGGQVLRAQRILDGLQAEGEAPVLVHWALAEDIRTLYRLRQAVDAGRPLPVALRENRVWGGREKLMERALPLLGVATLAKWLDDAHVVDGIVKGLRAEGWPADPWRALQQLAMRVAQATAGVPPR
jgi:DNA polymerase-3 subunit delta